MTTEKDYILWLNSIEGIGSKTLEKLLSYFGSAENIYRTSEDNLLKAKGINKDIIHNIVKNREHSKVDGTLEILNRDNIDILFKSDDHYPINLRNIYDAPYALYIKGEINEKDKNAVAIVGARKASPYGKWAAYKFAGELAKRGITIVSGLAYGIDSAAHKGALDSGGRTIAVLGSGIDICYPKSNQSLMASIQQSGAVVSEYGVGVQPLPGNFPARNRIISGLVKGVIVVEATEKSGSLITAEFALEQGREVFSVPGNINSALSKGTNRLIKEGAKIVTYVEDILEELDLEVEQIDSAVTLSDIENRIYDFICHNQPVPLETISYKLKTHINQINSIVTILQLKGLIEQLPGKIIVVK